MPTPPADPTPTPAPPERCPKCGADSKDIAQYYTRFLCGSLWYADGSMETSDLCMELSALRARVAELEAGLSHAHRALEILNGDGGSDVATDVLLLELDGLLAAKGADRG